MLKNMRKLAGKVNKSGALPQELTFREEKRRGELIKYKILIFPAAILTAAALTLAAVWFLEENNFYAVEKKVLGKLAVNTGQSQSVAGESAEETPKAAAAEESAAMKSENYKIGQIKFGGDAIFLSGSDENVPLEIYDARSETVSSKNGKEHKLMIVWKTNKLAVSKVEYSESSGQNPKIAGRDGYGFDHSVILSDLEPATAYVYKIKAKDRWGNETVSDYFGAYTGKKADSVFELVVKAVNEVFGWAMKK